MEFDWDEGNLPHATKRIPKGAIESAFADPSVYMGLAKQSGDEMRCFCTGYPKGFDKLYIVIYCRRDAKIRPDSARRAWPKEERNYRSAQG